MIASRAFARFRAPVCSPVFSCVLLCSPVYSLHERAQYRMSEPRRADPLEGITLKAMVEHLVERYGWEGLGARIEIRCFTHDPSVPSSLKFLRKTPWARAKVESLYLHSVAHPRKGTAPAVSDQPGPD